MTLSDNISQGPGESLRDSKEPESLKWEFELAPMIFGPFCARVPQEYLVSNDNPRLAKIGVTCRRVSTTTSYVTVSALALRVRHARYVELRIVVCECSSPI